MACSVELPEAMKVKELWAAAWGRARMAAQMTKGHDKCAFQFRACEARTS